MSPLACVIIAGICGWAFLVALVVGLCEAAQLGDTLNDDIREPSCNDR